MNILASLRLLICIQLFVFSLSARAMKRVILDVDVGTDDAWGILIFLHAEKQGLVKIEAITCTMGNASVDDVCKNVVRLLESLGRTDIPVFKGSSKAIIDRPLIGGYFGKDGFGDLKHEKEPNLSVIKATPSAVGLCEMIKKNPNEISLILLAPLTNAALAARLQDDFVSLLKEILIMGGNDIGSSNPSFNFQGDPESAQMVLELIKSDTYMFYDQNCKADSITLEWLYNVLDKSNSAGVKLITRAEKKVYPPSPGKTWAPCDAFAVFAYLYPDNAVIKRKSVNATIELCDKNTLGLMIGSKSQKLNLNVIEKIGIDSFKKIFMEVVR